MEKERRAPVTQEQIWFVADRLSQAGEEPTCSNIVEVIGGSMTTISKQLRAWRAARSSIRPPDIQLATEIHSAIAKQIQSEVDSAPKRLEARLAACASDTVELTKAATIAEEEVENLSDQLRALQLEIQHKSWQIHAMTGDLETALQQVELGRRERESLQVELGHCRLMLETTATLKDESQRLDAELNRERAMRTAAELAAAVAQERAAGLRARITEAGPSQAMQRAGPPYSDSAMPESSEAATQI
ncbi:MAG: DNA-binding protein [Rhodocyclaceae bacterium]|nr:DNA-binding protein [Rhodocyclaceae bacterium]